MRIWARAIVGALLVTGLSCEAARSQSFAGWLPFRDDEKETFVKPPSSLGASAAEAPAKSVSASGGATGTSAATQRGGTDVAPAQVASGGTPPARTAMVPEEQSSYFPSFSWPQMQMPYFPRPQWLSTPSKQEAVQARNTWVEPNPEPAKPSPWQAVTSGATQVKQSTANAWHKTVDMLTPGGEPEPRARVAQKEPSIWSRMFSSETEKPEGPQTVTEWMAQDRVKP
jgi:hypothetical protein